MLADALLVDVVAWLAAAGVLAVGGVLSLTVARRERPGRERPEPAWAALFLALAASLTGLIWRATRIAAWPAVTPAGALACWGAGALIVTAWLLMRWARSTQSDSRAVPMATGLALLGSALLLGSAGVLAWRTPAAVSAAGARSGIFGVLVILASVGLGGWAPVFSGSAWGVWAAGQRGEFPAVANDAGRAAALFVFPGLTAAVFTAVLWSLAAHVTVLQATAGNLWLLAAWLFGAAYLHATSAWRPLRLPARLATALAACALAAGIMTALNVATIL